MRLPGDQTLQNLRFILLITGLSLLYHYPETLMKRPQSVHNWRQCDGASLALCYYQEGMHFFKPQTQLLYADGNTTGYAAPSEIPILYYFTAILYKIFGFHEFIFRALNLFLFFLGLFYLFKLASAVLKHPVYPLLVVTLIFSSPLLVYYGNNFLPNTVALSFSFIAWFHFYRYSINKQNGTFLLSMLFFTVAGSMKITELSGPLIILALMAADKLKIANLGISSRKGYLVRLSALVLPFVAVAGWVMYAKWYNQLHGATQFSTFTFPIWHMNNEEIAFTLHKMNVLWFQDYFFPATLYAMLACLLLMLVYWRKSLKILAIPSVILVFGFIAYCLLWFQALGDHDYFMIGFYVLPAFLFINAFFLLQGLQVKLLHQRIIQVVLALFVVLNITHAHHRHRARYHSWMNDYREVKDIYTINPWLAKAGINRSDTVVFYPSVYIRPIYLMNLKGWTIFNHDEINTAIVDRDSLQMKTFIGNGAEYFITNDIGSACIYPPLVPYMKDLVGTYGNVYVFRVPPRKENFSPADFAVAKPQ